MSTTAQSIVLDAGDTQLRLSQVGSSQQLLIDWRSIRRVVAFKRDLLTRDLMCLALELNTDEVIELDESMIGWSQLMDALPAHLPGAMPAAEWYPLATFPAFAESKVEVFTR